LYFLGIDVGTSRVKCSLFTPNGEEVSSSDGEYSLHHPHPGWSELNPDEIWGQIRAVIRGSLKQVDPKEVSALSLSVIGHPIMPIDKNGMWLYPIIQYYDSRATHKETEELQNMIGLEKLSEINRYRAIKIQQPLANIWWLKKNMPKIFNKASKFIGVHEYVLGKLCGSYWLDYSLASCTSLFNFQQGVWDSEIFDTLNLDIDLMPQVTPSGTEIGEVSSEASHETGLARGTQVVVGAHDAHCSPLGTGIVEEGLLMDETGTVEHIIAVSPLEKAMNFLCVKINRTRNIPIVSAGFRTSGSILRWFRDTFSHEEKTESNKTGKDVYDILTSKASRASPGSDGVVLIPDFVGDTTGGAFLGLALNHDKSQVIRAILEGITFEIRSCFEYLINKGIKTKEIRVVGGGAKSPFWLQLKADITKQKIVTPAYTMPGTRGAVILAGIGVKEYQDAFEGVQRIYEEGIAYHPNYEKSLIYEKYYEKYQRIKSLLTSNSKLLKN
jgi:xylulokinase